MKPFAVVADDRTGAMETAGACADLGCSTVVVPLTVASSIDASCTVLDIASRHVAVHEARTRAASAPAHALHKIDSTLRGMWAHELVARHEARSVSVLVVPAFPAAGRTCEGGVVRVDGVPVADGAAGSDVRGPVRSSRPADHLRDAGATAVDALTPAGVAEWLAAPNPGFAVCDAASDADLEIIARAWSGHADVLLAGTAAVVASGARAVLRPTTAPARRPVCATPALVVCGSLHPMALAQAAAAEAKGMIVLRPTSAERDDPVEVASELAAAALVVIAAGEIGTVVVVGGDTTAALLGDRAVVVGGTLAPGVAWSRAWADDGPLLATKPGGFGTPSTIVDLFPGGLQ